jgi:tetratricopeptide (TPR) repeat protein
VPNNPREIYDSTGDSLSALRALENSKNGTATATGTGGSTHSASSYAPFEHYNRVLLAGLSKQKLGIPKDDDETFIHRLGIAHAAVLDAHESQIKAGIKASPFDVQREIWQLTYNQTLMFIAHGNYDLAKASVVNELGPLLDALTNAKAAGERGKQALEDMELPSESAKLGCRLGFALLESTLSKYPFQLTNNDGTQVDVKYLKSLTDFLQENVERKDVGGDDPQLKFLWSLYKSRLDFFQRDHDGKLVDSSIRSARKELKTAMEIFQHKLLRGAASNESASLASSSSAGAGTSGGVSSVSGTGGGGGGGGGDTLTPSVQQQYVQPTMPRDLQAANRAALNLKANTELLKGNVKKSLVLCGEALSSVSYDESYDDQTKTYYDAIHQNNLALIYAASGKYYLASHALSKAITAAEASGSLVDRFERADGGRISAERRVSTAPCNFDTDGTVRADLTVQILNNAAICSLRTGNYLAAYECMSKCIENSEIWQNRTRSWIHLAEACIGK